MWSMWWAFREHSLRVETTADSRDEASDPAVASSRTCTVRQELNVLHNQVTGDVLLSMFSRRFWGWNANQFRVHTWSCSTCEDSRLKLEGDLNQTATDSRLAVRSKPRWLFASDHGTANERLILLLNHHYREIPCGGHQ